MPGSIRAVTLLTLLVAIYTVLSPIVLYAFTIAAVDAQWWTVGVGVLLGILAVARVRRPRTTTASAIGLLVGGVLLLVLPFAFGYRPDGPLAVPFWNLVVCGGTMTLLSGVGLLQLRRASRSRSSGRS